MRMRAAILVLMFAQGLAGCSGSNTSPAPMQPTALSSVTQTTPQGVDPVPQGYVLDSAFRAVAGASVQIIDGPQAGTSMTSDSTGQFSLTGTFVGTETFRATKEGYVSATQGFNRSMPGGRPWLRFYLKPLAPPVSIAGDYTLTFIADGACADLPTELRTRTYAATITPGSEANSPAETAFDLTVHGTPLLGKFTGFGIGVAGNSLGFWLHGGHDPPLVEHLATNTYLAYSGWAEATVSTSTVSTIATPFEGWIEYCVMHSEMNPGYNCGTSNVTGEPIPGLAVARAHCESANHQLILTRR